MDAPERAHGPVTVAALRLAGVDKRFGRVVALDDATLSVRPGTVHALLGENGAGKTTLVRIACGLAARDRGEVLVGGAPQPVRSAADAIRAGLALVQQHFSLVPAMSVLENVTLGSSPRLRRRDEVQALADEAGLRLDVSRRVADLAVGDQQRTELLKALARRARVLLLDEPTASLPPADAEALFDWLRGFRQRGGSVVLITHRLREALAIADDITVLRRGRVSWSGSREAATAGGLVAAMLGSAPADAEPGPPRGDPGACVLSAIRVDLADERGRPCITDATFDVHGGEIVGVAGVEGSGVHELLFAAGGRSRPTGGRLELPAEIGFIPEDRQRDALLVEASIADNAVLRNAGRRRGWLRRDATAAAGERLLRAGGIGAVSVRSATSSLSGGNQQRLVLARELEGEPSLIVAVNPTRGLDVSATAEVRVRLLAAAARGAAVLYHTADLDELLDIADRVLVAFGGRVRHVPRDRDAIGRALVGAS